MSQALGEREPGNGPSGGVLVLVIIVIVAIILMNVVAGC